LLPAIGIKHSNRSNAFCLADDLIEPLRPLVDARVQQLRNRGKSELTPDVKAMLLEVLADRVEMGEQHGPLLVNMHRYVASLVKCYQGKSKRLEIPTAHECSESSADELPNGSGAEQDDLFAEIPDF